MNWEAVPAGSVGLGKASSRCVLLFVKSPQKGRVKTRLSAHLTDDITLNLYKCFVLDLIETLQKGRYPFKITFYPQDSEKKIISWLGTGYSYTPQMGRNLGERMSNAFRKAFSEGYDEVLVIGTDIPDLTPLLIGKAFEALKENDATIGPCFDGGYYLIGFKKETFFSEIFKGIKWSTKEVFQKTVALFLNHGYKVFVLPKLRDIDRLEDLKAFYRKNKKRKARLSKALSYLSSLENILGYER